MVKLLLFNWDNIIVMREMVLQVYFGQNMVCEDLHEGKENIIKLEDPVYVMRAVTSYDDTLT